MTEDTVLHHRLKFQIEHKADLWLSRNTHTIIYVHFFSFFIFFLFSFFFQFFPVVSFFFFFVFFFCGRIIIGECSLNKNFKQITHSKTNCRNHMSGISRYYFLDIMGQLWVYFLCARSLLSNLDISGIIWGIIFIYDLLISKLL